jgi:hypothetical protein
VGEVGGGAAAGQVWECENSILFYGLFLFLQSFDTFLKLPSLCVFFSNNYFGL